MGVIWGYIKVVSGAYRGYIPLSPEMRLQRAAWVLTRLSASRGVGECKTRWNEELAERVLGLWTLVFTYRNSWVIATGKV